MEIKEHYVTEITYINLDEDGLIIKDFDNNKFQITKKEKGETTRSKHWVTIRWYYYIRRKPEQLSLF